MKNSTLKVLAGVVSASMALMAMISVVSAEDPIYGNDGILTIGRSTAPGTSGNGGSSDSGNGGSSDSGNGGSSDSGNGGSSDSGNGGSSDSGNGGSSDSGNGGSSDSGNGGSGDSGNGGSSDSGNGGSSDSGNGGSSSSAASGSPVLSGGGSSRVGDGAVSASADSQPVSTAQAVSAITSVKSGGNVAITMGKHTVIPAKAITAFASKSNASLTLNYSGVGITINSDDVDADVVQSLSFKTSVRFLTRAEMKAFAGAKEVRQLALTGKSLNGIDKVTVTFKMRGGSKGMNAKLLLRTANGKYILVDEAVVGDDRNVDFEITEAGNYIVYTGEADIEYEAAE